MKTCTKCGETKPLSEFYRRSKPDLYQTEETRHRSDCKSCIIAIRRAKYAADPHWKSQRAKRETLRNTCTKCGATKPEEQFRRPGRVCKACTADWRRLHRQAKPEPIERQRERSRRQYAKNPQRFLAKNRKRKALRRGAAGSERFNPADIFQRDGWRCHICGKPCTPTTATIDHLIPISKGGADAPTNVATAHRSCNARRGAGRLPAQLRIVG